MIRILEDEFSIDYHAHGCVQHRYAVASSHWKPVHP